MLRLSEIRDLVLLLDDERRCPVADSAAAEWGHPPGAARFRRSSACHVFAIEGSGFLRFVPATHRPRTEVGATAGLMARLHRAGLAVAEPIRSRCGELVCTVDTELGELHAMLVSRAPGAEVDVVELTVARSTAWGAALARLHHEVPDDGSALPGPFPRLDPAHPAFADDPELAAAVHRLGAALLELPRDRDRFGVVHGDFELDNLAWDGDHPTAYDFDEAARSWFVADIAAAVGDLGPVPARTPAGDEAPMFAAFLAGYRRHGPLAEPDLASLPLFTTAHAATTLAGLHPVLDAGAAEGDPEWLVRLRGRLHEHVRRLRAQVLAAAP